MSIRRAQDERIEGTPDGFNAITEINDVPDAPTIGAATNVGTSRAYNNGSATVAYTAATTGGAVTTFTATSSPGGFTGTGSSPITVTGLQSATSYTFTVNGTNAASVTGASSAATSSITATTVPQAPTIGTVTVTNSTTVSVPFTAGATGGSNITSYTVTSSPSISLSTSGSSTPLTVTGTFASGTAYTFTVTATNANGTSAASSASNSVTPLVPPPSYIASYTPPSNYTQRYGFGQDTVVDSSGNWYVFGGGYNNRSGTQDEDGVLLKFNSEGTLQWQRKFTPPTGQPQGVYTRKVRLDSSGNVYLCGMYSDSTRSNYATGYLIKYNSSGTLQWQRKLVSSGQTDNNSMIIDSSDNIFVGGRSNYGGSIGSGSDLLWLAKYNSSGTIQWQRYIVPTSGASASWEALLFDSSDSNTIGCGYGYNYEAVLAKYNTSGTIQWQRRLYSAGNAGYWSSMALDSSKNIYVTGWDIDNGNIIIAKYNSSGTIQWQRKTSAFTTGKIVIDGSDNIYVIASNLSYILKYDTSGTLLTQKALTVANATGKGVYNATFINGFIHVTGYFAFTGSIYHGASFQISTSLTNGTYNGPNSATVTIASTSAVTETTATYSTQNSTFSNGTATSTDSAGAMVDAAGAMVTAWGTF